MRRDNSESVGTEKVLIRALYVCLESHLSSPIYIVVLYYLDFESCFDQNTGITML